MRANTQNKASEDTENFYCKYDNKLSFDDQLKIFLDKILLEETEINKNYKAVCNELQEIFKTTFLKCKVTNFGSTAIGLGFKNCDLDVYLDIGRPVSDSNDDSGPTIISFKSLFPIVLNILQKNSKIFTKIFPIPSAKMPIIKFVHRRTQINCDISFKHCIALFNSELVKFYVSLDTRFKTLMIILKYWIHKCKKVNRITNYSLSMLVIFFLQQLRLVPTVHELQRKCKVPVTCKGWQVNFEKSITSWDSNRHHENLGVPELLEKFFVFYKNYDFDSFVICPFDGQSHNKKLFKDCEDLPVTMSRYINNFQNGKIKNHCWRNKVCLQDPIELNVNLTHNITAAELDLFQSYACIYATVVKDAANNNYQDLLKNLFSDQKTIKAATVAKQVSFSIQPNEFLSISSTEDIKENYTFIKNNWFDSTIAMIQEYLEKVLNFKLQINQDNDETNKENFKILSNSTADNHSLISLNCKGNCCLWKDRKQIKIFKDIGPLKKEIEISKILLESKLSGKTTEINFKCLIEKKFNANIFIDLTLINQGCARSIFAEVANFLSSHMPSVIKKNQNYLLHIKRKNSSKSK